MNKLDKRTVTDIKVEPNKGERTFLSSNESDQRSPFLGFLDTSSDNISKDMVLDYLAHIIAEIYLNQTYGNKTNKESSTILSGINKGTG
jgi:hypothetical protein